MLDGFVQITKFTQEITGFPLHSNGLIDVPKDLADIVESTIGAVFIDSNSCLDTVWKLIGRASYGLKKDIAYNRAAKDALDNIGE
ncbi:hypothetical protein FNV43_RR13315 [Rhamnella rubrinervis]|uniref:RNase III domain-containing protein n=1 Tax=Rhamnella rubrinervis TaxID=2594499 RepID=A0A8K0H100_9ROSA|nr:hypothetical protein FNV43_RR13315 [Rhamnella rubrinervis]